MPYTICYHDKAKSQSEEPRAEFPGERLPEDQRGSSEVGEITQTLSPKQALLFVQKELPLKK